VLDRVVACLPSVILWKERVVLNVVNESVEGGVGVVTRVAVAVIVAIVCRGVRRTR